MKARAGLPERITRLAEHVASDAARAAWPWVQRFNRAFERGAAHPSWAPSPLLKRRERTRPELGWPRETDSLCPKCVKEARAAILSGERDLTELRAASQEIRAKIDEADGEIRMTKTYAAHGAFTDVMSIDPAFTARIERLYPAATYLAPATRLRDHGSSSVKYGRGSVLTVDLTNRCNMMCDPCFMDANQVGFVHELEWDESKKILDDSLTIEPRRQMSVQFSGGEPTLSPHFLSAVRYAREVGYFCVQSATNGVRFAQDRDFAMAAKEAGLRIAYLQFDGVTNEANAHRKVGNLFDVKLRAIENLHAAGIDVVLVVTVVNGVNDEQVGPILDFAVANADKITVVSFQPVSFTGRDEDIDDETRRAPALHALAPRPRREERRPARPSRSATGSRCRRWGRSAISPTCCWASSQWGALKCGCHPNCGDGHRPLRQQDGRSR